MNSFLPKLHQVLASGTNTTSNPGVVKVYTADGGVMYLQTKTIPQNPTTTQVYNFLGSQITIPEGFFSNLGELINKLLTFVIAVAALLVFAYLIWGAFDWITSGGDKGKIDQARQKIVAAVIGLIIVASSFAILTIALNFLGIKSLQEAINTATGLDQSKAKVVVIEEATTSSQTQ